MTKQALIRALDEYEGTIIFVSHDRFFVDEIANKVMYFTKGKSYFHDGNYETFKELEKGLFLLEDEPKKENIKVKEDKPVKKSNLSLGKLEDKIGKTEKKIKELKESQFDEEIYSSIFKMREVDAQIEALTKELEALEEDYLSRSN